METRKISSTDTAMMMIRLLESVPYILFKGIRACSSNELIFRLSLSILVGVMYVPLLGLILNERSPFFRNVVIFWVVWAFEWGLTV
jgi:hypothetical protein